MPPRKKRLISTSIAAVAATAAVATQGINDASAATPLHHRPRHKQPPEIVVTDQGGHQILVLAADRSSWAQRRSVWRWRPTKAEGFRLTADWGQPDEAKLRARHGQKYLLTTDSKGLAAVVPYPLGRNPYWAVDLGPKANPHSIDLLPDGDVAVVASNGGWLRVYTAANRRRPTSFAAISLKQAHGVYWDGHLNVLWAVGDRQLVAIRVGGNAAQPRLTVLHRATLPSVDGHDLEPVAGRPDRLWITTGKHIYQYVKPTGRFVRNFPGSRYIDGREVKSIGQDPSTGQVLTATVQRGNHCRWCTNTAILFHPAGELTFPGGEFYKIRWWIT